jgi:Macrocin-O-methyltransferase (TylF)
MNRLKTLVKQLFWSLGWKIIRRDRLEEQIPVDYMQSLFLPRVYRQSVGRLFYFRHMYERINNIPGDIVECGVSTGHGILYWALLCELTATIRKIWGFDSFSGFPASTEADKKADGSFRMRQHDYASPPEMALKVLSDGRVSTEFVTQYVRLVRGYFEETLHQYDGEIALLHLDCDLYESYTTCLNALYPKVRSGGIIMFDEYEDSDFPGAKRAIDEFFRGKPEKPLIYHDYEYLKYYVIKS